MRKTAPYKGLFMVAVAILLLSGTDPHMACSEPDPSATDDVKTAANPDSLSNTNCEKHVTVEVKQFPPEPYEPAQAPSPPALKQKQAAKSEAANGNMSFNFLYYLFYKFSVSEFFKTPDFSDSTIF